MEVVSDHRGDTNRVVYAARLAGQVYLLHAFQKKSKKGIATPKAEIDLLTEGFRRALAKAERRRLTQVRAAEILDVDQPKIPALKRGRFCPASRWNGW